MKPGLYKTLFTGLVMVIAGLLIGSYANPKVRKNESNIEVHENRLDAHDVSIGKSDVRWEMIQEDIQEIKQAVKER